MHTARQSINRPGKDASSVDNDWFLCPLKILDHEGPLGATFPVENRLTPQVRAGVFARARFCVCMPRFTCALWQSLCLSAPSQLLQRSQLSQCCLLGACLDLLSPSCRALPLLPARVVSSACRETHNQPRTHTRTHAPTANQPRCRTRQSASALRDALRRQSSGQPYGARLCDLHLLLWLAGQPNLDESDMGAIAEAARDKGDLMEGYRVIIDSIAGI